jgi:hypothetical protein
MNSLVDGTMEEERDLSWIHKFIFPFTALSVAQDLILATMPATILWHLQRGRGERIRLMLLLGLGSSAAVATLVRIYFLTSEVLAIHGNGPAFICTALELSLAMIAGSMAPLRKSIARTWNCIRGRKWLVLRKNTQTQSQTQTQSGIELPERSVSLQQLVDGTSHE